MTFIRYIFVLFVTSVISCANLNGNIAPVAAEKFGVLDKTGEVGATAEEILEMAEDPKNNDLVCKEIINLLQKQGPRLFIKLARHNLNSCHVRKYKENVSSDFMIADEKNLSDRFYDVKTKFDALLRNKSVKKIKVDAETIDAQFALLKIDNKSAEGRDNIQEKIRTLIYAAFDAGKSEDKEIRKAAEIVLRDMKDRGINTDALQALNKEREDILSEGLEAETAALTAKTLMNFLVPEFLIINKNPRLERSIILRKRLSCEHFAGLQGYVCKDKNPKDDINIGLIISFNEKGEMIIHHFWKLSEEISEDEKKRRELHEKYPLIKNDTEF